MEHTVSCSWNEKLSFTSRVNGHSIVLDADDQFGGEDKGPRPKLLLLSALAGCTGMDVISILGKMKIQPSFFNIDIRAPLSENHPKTYTSISVVYQFKAADELDRSKVERACTLSQENYCGVSEMLRKACDINWEIEYI